MTLTYGVLGLDPSSKAVGWAYAEGAAERGTSPDGAPPHSSRPLAQDMGWPTFISSVWRPGVMLGSSEAKRHSELCGRASMWLADMISDLGPGVIVIESGGGRMTDRTSERLRGALLGTAYVREIAVDLVQPSSWQAWAKRTNGWGKADKSDEFDARNLLAYWLAART